MTEAQRDLLYFAYRASGGKRWNWRQWWRAVDLLPNPCDMPVNGPGTWSPIAESLAYEGRPARGVGRCLPGCVTYWTELFERGKKERVHAPTCPRTRTAAKKRLCKNCHKPFVFWRDHWHCMAPSCDVFRCKKAARTAAKGGKR